MVDHKVIFKAVSSVNDELVLSVEPGACLPSLWKSMKHNEVQRVAEHHKISADWNINRREINPTVIDMNQAVHDYRFRLIGLCRISSWFPIMDYDYHMAFIKSFVSE